MLDLQEQAETLDTLSKICGQFLVIAKSAVQPYDVRLQSPFANLEDGFVTAVLKDFVVSGPVRSSGIIQVTTYLNRDYDQHASDNQP
jgi:hypothetical protein